MKNYLSLVKFSHTIFALPFALVGYFLAVALPEYQFDWKVLVLVLLCMIFARNAAMAFNRWQDQDIDGDNPRTAVREIPAGVLSSNAVLIFTVINCLAFIATTYFINPICFYLSPIALLITLGYSYTKRFTALCHVVLGMGLALAPVGANLAVTGSFSIIPIMFGFAILFWVAGFDIIYYSSISMIHYLGAIIFIGLLVYQHTLVKINDLSKVNLAFFTTNGFASVIFGSLLIIDLFI